MYTAVNASAALTGFIDDVEELVAGTHDPDLLARGVETRLEAPSR